MCIVYASESTSLLCPFSGHYTDTQYNSQQHFKCLRASDIAISNCE